MTDTNNDTPATPVVPATDDSMGAPAAPWTAPAAPAAMPEQPSSMPGMNPAPMGPVEPDADAAAETPATDSTPTDPAGQ